MKSLSIKIIRFIILSLFPSLPPTYFSLPFPFSSFTLPQDTKSKWIKACKSLLDLCFYNQYNFFCLVLLCVSVQVFNLSRTLPSLLAFQFKVLCPTTKKRTKEQKILEEKSATVLKRFPNFQVRKEEKKENKREKKLRTKGFGYLYAKQRKRKKNRKFCKKKIGKILFVPDFFFLALDLCPLFSLYQSSQQTNSWDERPGRVANLFSTIKFRFVFIWEWKKQKREEKKKNLAKKKERKWYLRSPHFRWSGPRTLRRVWPEDFCISTGTIQFEEWLSLL